MSSNPFAVMAGRFRLFALLALLGLIAGCQVRPLYDEASGTQQSLGSIAFSRADDRVELEVRNQLIFLVAGGAGEPAAPEYTVDLKVKSETIGVLLEQSSDTPRAGRVVVSADYTLSRVKDGTVLRMAHRQSVALVDYPEQEFAKLRAIRDAENRAARELAELIRADLAAVLSR